MKSNEILPLSDRIKIYPDKLSINPNLDIYNYDDDILILLIKYHNALLAAESEVEFYRNELTISNKNILSLVQTIESTMK